MVMGPFFMEMEHLKHVHAHKVTILESYCNNFPLSSSWGGASAPSPLMPTWRGIVTRDYFFKENIIYGPNRFWNGVMYP